MDPIEWGDASLTYEDWRGTAALDEKMTGPDSLNKAVGLGNEWHIIGIDIGGGESDHNMRVVAVHDDIVPEGGGIAPRIAREHGGVIPVTEFLVHGVDPYAVLQRITHMFELRLRWRSAEGIPIEVRSLGDSYPD